MRIVNPIVNTTIISVALASSAYAKTVDPIKPATPPSLPMTAITDLDTLLASMSPSASPGLFVFVTVPHASYGAYAALAPIGSFQEKEGLTLILDKKTADEAKLAYEGTFTMITLNVHSSLAAVGLTAAVATALTKSGISANVIAAYFHDHVFVPSARADDALAALTGLTQGHANKLAQ
ncbi:ACT domain-containing protein [Glaciimonas sp. GG7]